MTENNVTTNASIQIPYNEIPLALISTTGVILNLLLLVAFIKDPLKCFRNSGIYLVMNLAVSDFLTCSVAPFYFAKRNETPITLSHAIVEFLEFWFGGVSFLSITSISIDRFLMVAHPLKRRFLMKERRIILWLAAIWMVSCIVAGSSLFHDRENNRNNCYIISMILIILSAAIYSLTYHKLKKQSKKVASQNSNESCAQQIRILKEKRFLKTIIIIACIAFVCVVPFMIFFLSYDSLHLSRDNVSSEIIGTAILFIVYINFAVNPLIYLLRLPNYRKTFHLLYWRRKITPS